MSICVGAPAAAAPSTATAAAAAAAAAASTASAAAAAAVRGCQCVGWPRCTQACEFAQIQGSLRSRRTHSATA